MTCVVRRVSVRIPSGPTTAPAPWDTSLRHNSMPVPVSHSLGIKVKKKNDIVFRQHLMYCLISDVLLFAQFLP